MLIAPTNMRRLGLIFLLVLATGCQFSENRYARRIIKPAEHDNGIL